ncbi:hypothetical protein [Actinomadura macra]|uniref:hypothetical protein n=1 Tax=Actinomadura macra TaxID=46164 RepID=UPI000836F48E|nr:hypothetical protein [Actinomadura macra]
MSTLTTEQFESTIDAIADHSIAHVEYAFEQVKVRQRPVAPPCPYVPRYRLDSEDDIPLPEDARTTLEQGKDEHKGDLDTNNEYVAPIAERRYNNEMSQSEFDKLIDDQADANIKKFTENQRDTAKKLKEIGNNNPRARGIIAQSFSAVSEFFTNLWSKVADFFGKLIQKLIDLWNKVVQFFTGLVDTIKKWWPPF